MKAVKGYTKNDYIAICQEEDGGESFKMCIRDRYIRGAILKEYQ